MDAVAIVCAVGLDSSTLEGNTGAATEVASEKAPLLCVSGGGGGAVPLFCQARDQFFDQPADFAFAPREGGAADASADEAEAEAAERVLDWTSAT